MVSGQVRKATGVVQNGPSLGAAADDLLMSGFDGSDMSVRAERRPAGRKLGAAADQGGDLVRWHGSNRDRGTPARHIRKRQAAREVHVQEAVHWGRIVSTVRPMALNS